MTFNLGYIRLSASDLSNHLACHHLTSLDLAVAIGERPKDGLKREAWSYRAALTDGLIYEGHHLGAYLRP